MLGMILLVVLVVLVAGTLHYFFGPFPLQWGAHSDTPAPLACWPWSKATIDAPHPGVTHWIDHSSPDGTVVEFFDFDFHQNPGLRLELYDQDEDDQIPYDDHATFWSQGVGQVTRHLNQSRRGTVVAAWTGLFFQYTGAGRSRVGRHVAPIVLQRRPHYNLGNIRWTFGVKYQRNRPVFNVFFQQPSSASAEAFDYAAAGASCLVYQGRPLRLEPFPKPGEDPLPPSKSSSPDEAGFVRQVDHIRTSRTSMAWSKDQRHFYLLIVKDPGSEYASIAALSHQIPLMGGWTVADLQRFWQQQGAWCAVNIDGGDVTQMTALRSDGHYDMVPPRWGDRRMRCTFAPDFVNAPAGGTMMYFYVRDRK
jgi:hypothetical protein